MPKIYLEDIPLDEAQDRFHSALEKADLWKILGSEELDLNESLAGRVLAETLWAKISSPHYHASAMDGFAVRAQETHGALETKPVTLVYGTQTEYLDTGDPPPDWADAVIMIEQVEPLDADGEK